MCISRQEHIQSSQMLGEEWTNDGKHAFYTYFRCLNKKGLQKINCYKLLVEIFICLHFHHLQSCFYFLLYFSSPVPLYQQSWLCKLCVNKWSLTLSQDFLSEACPMSLTMEQHLSPWKQNEKQIILFVRFKLPTFTRLKCLTVQKSYRMSDENAIPIYKKNRGFWTLVNGLNEIKLHLHI